MNEVKRYWISRDTPGSEIPVTSGRMVSVVLASDYDALEASIPAGKREAYCEGWFGALESCTDYHHADVMPQKHAARRYPDKEAT